ncbi:hypothetical protein PROFUN_01783 [Planoprotostelium fungivorum]|uniref:Uncharacterized protein n=1 Tax=Planoprotostelium fungivorum TaxID=1890364 RepID=A0A2P6MWJ6_9EUKA|nr:hypothetical protein PROFUN_01783 [Planoprotostelium fungivorum]
MRSAVAWNKPRRTGDRAEISRKAPDVSYHELLIFQEQRPQQPPFFVSRITSNANTLYLTDMRTAIAFAFLLCFAALVSACPEGSDACASDDNCYYSRYHCCLDGVIVPKYLCADVNKTVTETAAAELEKRQKGVHPHEKRQKGVHPHERRQNGVHPH